jgi:hypothetical protein
VCHKPDNVRITAKQKVDRVWKEVVISSNSLRRWTDKTSGNLIQQTQHKGRDFNSDYHLLSFVKNQMRGQLYETKKALQSAVRQCLRTAGTEFYRKGIFKLPERWEKFVQRNRDYVEK